MPRSERIINHRQKSNKVLRYHQVDQLEQLGDAHGAGLPVSFFLEFRLRCSARSDALRICALILALAGTCTSGCGTSHATLQFNAPPSASAGTPFTVTVNVLYQGKPDTVINSPIHFTSSDPAAILPPDYYFTPADAGSHTWTNGFTLSTPGNQTISGAIFDATGINGSATIEVSP